MKIFSSECKGRLIKDAMPNFHELKDFEKRFKTMDVEELKRWKKYWTLHAEGLSPKVKKQAMKRVHEIEKAIEQRSKQDD